VCGKSKCGKKFDFGRCTSVGFMLGDTARPRPHQEGAKTIIIGLLVF